MTAPLFAYKQLSPEFPGFDDDRPSCGYATDVMPAPVGNSQSLQDTQTDPDLTHEHDGEGTSESDEYCVGSTQEAEIQHDHAKNLKDETSSGGYNRLVSTSSIAAALVFLCAF
jgi:hypothetical protein